MDVAIPPEFEAFARAQVEAGASTSAEEVVATALKDYLTRIEDLRASIDVAIVEADRGEAVDGRAILRDLIAKSRARREA